MNKYIIVLFILIISACAPSRFVQPLNEGEQRISFNIGGSLIDYNGTTIPIPLTSITYGKGISEKITAFGSLHTTSLLFNNFQTEVGVLSEFRKQQGWTPAFSSTLALNFVSELSEKNSKLWPQIDGNAYWSFDKNKYLSYIGYSIWIDSKINDGIGIINPHVGCRYRTGNWGLGIEMKFLAPGHDNSKVFVPYKSLQGDKGATGLYFNVSKRF